MNSSEIRSYRKKLARYGENTHSYEELKALVEEALNPPKKPKQIKDKSQCKYHSKPILVYDLDGNFLGEFYSTTDAEKFTGVSHSHISIYLRGIVKTAKGYDFRYKTQQVSD